MFTQETIQKAARYAHDKRIERIAEQLPSHRATMLDEWDKISHLMRGEYLRQAKHIAIFVDEDAAGVTTEDAHAQLLADGVALIDDGVTDDLINYFLDASGDPTALDVPADATVNKNGDSAAADAGASYIRETIHRPWMELEAVNASFVEKLGDAATQVDGTHMILEGLKGHLNHCLFAEDAVRAAQNPAYVPIFTAAKELLHALRAYASEEGMYFFEPPNFLLSVERKADGSMVIHINTESK